MRRRKRIQMKVMMVLGIVALIGPNHLQSLILNNCDLSRKPYNCH
ncbi:hypothetical protein [Veillonella rogosae]|nr:hypothetical protein [Veillonella rogosae]